MTWSDGQEPTHRPVAKDEVVSRWLGAHNERDLDRMLAYTDPDLVFRPLRLVGARDTYEGHEGLRTWFEEIERTGVAHRFHVSELRHAGGDQVIAIGSVNLPSSRGVAEFYGLYEVPRDVIAEARHYISDRQTMRELGLLGPLGGA